MKLSNRDKRLLEEVVLANPAEDIINAVIQMSDKSNLANFEDDTSCEEKQDNTCILNFICILEGYRIRFREYHWSTDTMASHKLCDDIMSALLNYEDQLAEEFQGIINYRIKPGTIKPIMNVSENSGIIEALNCLVTDIINLKKSIQRLQNINYDGILNIIDDMIHTINTFKYLATFK